MEFNLPPPLAFLRKKNRELGSVSYLVTVYPTVIFSRDFAEKLAARS